MRAGNETGPRKVIKDPYEKNFNDERVDIPFRAVREKLLASNPPLVQLSKSTYNPHGKYGRDIDTDSPKNLNKFIPSQVLIPDDDSIGPRKTKIFKQRAIEMMS
jgi:hypothetical protein